MVEQDYITRLISGIIRTILKLVFHNESIKEEDINFENENAAQKYDQLTQLIEDGKVNEAENVLLDSLDVDDIEQYELVLRFYSYLNDKDDEYLDECNYTRKEIVEGIKYVSKMYGYQGLTTPFLDIE